MEISLLMNALVTAGLAVVSVALWTLRVAVTAAGRRLAAASVAGLEAVTFTLAFSRIVTNLDNMTGILAYALGVGAGTLLGLLLNARMSTGQSWVRVIVEGGGEALTAALLQRHWPVTALPGTGPSGQVTELVIAVDDTYLPRLIADLDAADPQAFRAVEHLREAHGRPLPNGLRQVGHPARHPHRTVRTLQPRWSREEVAARRRSVRG